MENWDKYIADTMNCHCEYNNSESKPWEKITGEPLEVDRMVKWVYKDDLDFWKEEQMEDQKWNHTRYEGIILPKHDMDVTSVLNVDDCVILIINSPVEKTSPKYYYISLVKLIDDEELVEFRVF